MQGKNAEEIRKKNMHKDTHKNIQVIRLPKAPKENVFDLIKAEPLF